MAPNVMTGPIFSNSHLFLMAMSTLSIKAGENLVSFDSPKVMGILNATPDSFYNKGRESSKDEIVQNACLMLDQGATFLDIGGMSSRPKADIIDVMEESNRVIPLIEAILKVRPQALISIDTYRADVADKAIHAGALLINDISGGDLDKDIWQVAAVNNTPYICMHMKGTPQNMQQNPNYDNVVLEVYQRLDEKLVTCREKGIKDVILDVGFGFGKTIEHNYQLLNEIKFFTNLQAPILVGLSRKSMIYKVCGGTSETALNGSTAAHMVALQLGAKILRVHDVPEAMDCVRIYNKLNNL